MTAIKVKQINHGESLTAQSRGRAMRAKLGSELLAANGREALEEAGKFVAVLLLIGLTIDLVLEAYLVWQSWNTLSETN